MIDLDERYDEAILARRKAQRAKDRAIDNGTFTPSHSIRLVLAERNEQRAAEALLQGGGTGVVGPPDAIYYDRSADEHIIVYHKSAKNYNRYGDTTKLRGE